ncbi:CAP domain-containing protein [Methylibium sp.]|uniref:CAP domain-containing protein n=1 Tax=Methylibium sp. TaxID=2067992 RepID=UPI0025DCA228|nr:CAP domain-containing protein [Methylibium sp.]
MQKHKSPLALAVLGLLLILQGCGGGGGGDGEEAHATSSTSSPQAEEAPAAAAEVPVPEDSTAAILAAPSGTDATCGLPDFQAEAMRLINARRAAGASCGGRGQFAAASALRWNGALASAAYGHSKDMATRNFFSHTGSDGSSFSKRITAAGYVWGGAAENIAAGQRSVRSVVDGWMLSPDHCANIMAASYRDAGLACVRNSSSRYGTYWTLNLARPR